MTAAPPSTATFEIQKLMPNDPTKHYDLEPGDESQGDSLRGELESEDLDRPLPTGDVHELDVCPSCGASMRGSDELVCMRCGFDLKTMKKLETQRGVVEVDEEGEEAMPKQPPLSPLGRGDLWMPGAVAGTCVVILVIAYAGGVPTLFEGSEPPNFGTRLVEIVRLFVRLLVWGGCALGALWTTARIINQQPLGEIRQASLRTLAAVAAINMARFIGLEHDTWEQGLELVLQAGAFPFVLIALFGISPRDAASTAIITVGTLLAMVLAPLIVSWSM